jgi:hypothetical protein
MTRQRASDSLRWAGELGALMPRFRLKPTAHGRGYVDGAWWPRSDDLITELSDLIAALSVHLGTVSRVIYNLSEWTTTPIELATGGRAVQLDGYRRRQLNTIELLDAQSNTTVLLVVPVNTDPDQAHAMVTAAAGSGNVSSIDTLLMISPEDRESRTKRDVARRRWDLQGQAPRSALASRVVAHAVLDRETQLVDLKKQLLQAK